MAPFLSDRNFSYMWVVWSRQCGGAGGRPGHPPPTPTNHIPSLTWIMTELSELEISYPTHSLSVNNKRCKYSLSQEEWTKLRESVPYVKLYRYNPKHLFPKLNGYGDKGQRKVWSFCGSTYCTWFA